jgi:hypothetical protein
MENSFIKVQWAILRMVISKSERFNILEQELNSLRANFLPEHFDPVGDYDSKEIALANAYRVLAHAEIESYFEYRALEISRNAVRLWKDEAKITISVAYLFAFSGLTMDSPPDSVTPDQESGRRRLEKRLDFNKKLTSVSNQFEKSVNENHGIKEKNILSLLLPIGINSNDIDRSWLQEMNSFGEKRGETAHTSASGYNFSIYTVRQPPDPQDELMLINRLVHGFAHIDYQSQNNDERLPSLIDIDQRFNNLLNS